MFERSEFADFSNVLIFQVFCNTGLAFLVTFVAMTKVTRALALPYVFALDYSKDRFNDFFYAYLQNIHSIIRTFVPEAIQHKTNRNSSQSTFNLLLPSF